MTYLKHTHAIKQLAERITKDKPTHKNVAFIHLQGQANKLLSIVEAIGKMHATPNPIETREAHIKRVSTAAGQLSAKVKEMQASINDITTQGLRSVGERIDQKVTLVPDAYAAEIRQVFRSLKQVEQIKLLGQLAEGNKGSQLAAIVKAPAILSGIDPDLQSTFADLIVHKHAPEEWEEQASLMDAMKTAFIITDVGKNVVAEYSDPAKLAVITRQEEDAVKAQSAFNTTLSNGVEA